LKGVPGGKVRGEGFPGYKGVTAVIDRDGTPYVAPRASKVSGIDQRISVPAKFGNEGALRAFECSLKRVLYRKICRKCQPGYISVAEIVDSNTLGLVQIAPAEISEINQRLSIDIKFTNERVELTLSPC
jgi:hypothetical protein